MSVMSINRTMFNDWNSTVLLVTEKDGELQHDEDLQQLLNNITIDLIEDYRRPQLINELISRLTGLEVTVQVLTVDGVDRTSPQGGTEQEDY